MTPDNPGTDGNGDTSGETSISADIDEEFPSIAATADEEADSTVDAGGDPFEAAESAGETPPEAAAESAGGNGLGWQGWVLVGGLIVAIVLTPWTIIFLPEMQGFLGSLGLGLRDAYLVLPMIPALGLGLLAVWAALAYRRRE